MTSHVCLENRWFCLLALLLLLHLSCLDVGPPGELGLDALVGTGLHHPLGVSGHELQLLAVSVLDQGPGHHSRGGAGPLPGDDPEDLAGGDGLQFVIQWRTGVFVDMAVIIPLKIKDLSCTLSNKYMKIKVDI